MNQTNKPPASIEIPISKHPPARYHFLHKEGAIIRERLVTKDLNLNFSSIVIRTIDDLASPLPIMFRGDREYYDSLSQLFLMETKSFVKKFIWQQQCSEVKAGVFFDTRTLEPNNVSHLLYNIIPRILLIKRELGPDIKFFFYKLRDNFVKLLNYFEIQPTMCTTRLKGRQVVLFITEGTEPMPFDVCPYPAIQMLPEIYQNSNIKNTITESRIFIARKNTRIFTNEPEIDSFLKKYGFKKFYFEELSIEDQISLASGAEYVIAAHGAALAYLLLNPSLKGVVEIHTPNLFKAQFINNTSFKTDCYIAIMPESDHDKIFMPWNYHARSWNLSFKPDIAFFEKAIEILGL